MAARRRNADTVHLESRRRPPATTPQGRENQLIEKANDLAERQIDEGTASSQVITHFLKLGSSRERLEQERLQYENELTRVKKEALESQAHREEIYADALRAMRRYQGEEVDDRDDS